jgi:hypothetical protein
MSFSRTAVQPYRSHLYGVNFAGIPIEPKNLTEHRRRHNRNGDQEVTGNNMAI